MAQVSTYWLLWSLNLSQDSVWEKYPFPLDLVSVHVCNCTSTSFAFVRVISCAGLVDIMSVCVRKSFHTNYVHQIQTHPHKSWIARQPFLKSWKYTPPQEIQYHIPSIYLHIYIYIYSHNLYTRHEPISDKFFVPAKVAVVAIHSQDFGASRASQDQKARAQGPQAQHISSSCQLFKLRKVWRNEHMSKCWLSMHV